MMKYDNTKTPEPIMAKAEQAVKEFVASFSTKRAYSIEYKDGREDLNIIQSNSVPDVYFVKMEITALIPFDLSDKDKTIYKD
jgi:hypothetical protein